MQLGLSNIGGIALLLAYFYVFKLGIGRGDEVNSLDASPLPILVLYWTFQVAHIFKNLIFSAFFNQSLFRLFDIPKVFGPVSMFGLLLLVVFRIILTGN